MERLFAIGGAALAVLLAACNGGASTSGTPAGSDVLDACKALNKSAIEHSLGAKIERSELSAVRDGSQGNGDRYSQCAYTLTGGGMVVIGTGESYGDPSVAEQVDSMRSEMKLGSNSPAESVAGVGQAALWNEGLHALYLFPGNKRFVALNMGAVGQRDPQAAAVALAHKLGF